MELKINSTFESCLPQLTSEEYTELEKSIIKNGILSPLLIWKGHNTIIDGHNRYRICQSHRIESFPTREMEFADEDHVIVWILQNQLARRNLNDNQRMAAVYKKKEAFAKIKEANSRANLIPNARGVVAHSTPSKEGIEKTEKKRDHTSDTLTQVAKVANVSRASMERFDYIQRHGNEEQKERAREGGQGNSVSAIAREIKEEKTGTRKCPKCGQELPLSKFQHGKICNACYNRQRDNAKFFDASGNRIKVGDAYKDISSERMRGNAYNPDFKLEYGIEDVSRSIEANIDGCIRTVSRIITDEMQKIKSGNIDIIDKTIDRASEKILDLRGLYHG